MAILKIARLGHPVLRQQARTVTAEQIHSPVVQRLIADMITTMQEDNGIGLAAPQVHQSLQLVVLGDAEAPTDDPDAIPLTVLINPRWLQRSPETEEDWEGCLSIPNLRGMVARSRRVVLQALDRRGEAVELEAEGFFARVLQHEIDHLDGTVYLDRMADLRRLAFLEEFGKYWVRAPAPDADQDE